VPDTLYQVYYPPRSIAVEKLAKLRRIHRPSLRHNGSWSSALTSACRDTAVTGAPAR